MNAQQLSSAAKRPPAAPIADGVWRIGGGSWNGHTEALSAENDGNVYLIRTRGAAVLVDCGTTAGVEAIQRNLAGRQQRAAPLSDLILSHSHWDHTQAAAHWQADAPFLRTHLNSVGAAYLDRGDHRLLGYQLQPPPHAFAPFRVDHTVSDHEEFELGDLRATALHLPGHTPDSTLYMIMLDGLVAAFCGDIAFQPRPAHGPALGQLCTLWLSNLDHYLDSLERMRTLSIDLLLPGHGDVVRGRQEVTATLNSTLELARTLAKDERFRENVGV
jgi:glyoxylase-like metal-dependent hydrolase (beta-lactamase superfamily II)